MSEMDNRARDAARIRRGGLVLDRLRKLLGLDKPAETLPTTITQEENVMVKGNPEGPMNRHKALAMGESIKLKKGGKVHSDEAEDKKLIKKMIKKEEKSEKKMAGGGCMKKGGKAHKAHKGKK